MQKARLNRLIELLIEWEDLFSTIKQCTLEKLDREIKCSAFLAKAHELIGEKSVYQYISSGASVGMLTRLEDSNIKNDIIRALVKEYKENDKERTN